MKNISVKICEENQNTHYVFSYFFFRKWCLYEIMWKNIVERGGPQMTLWRMCISCWLPKATDKLSEDILLLAFPQQNWLHERSSVLRYTYCACHVLHWGASI